jgi:FixJ family two-component response regulator
MTEWLKILLEHAGFSTLIGTRGEELFKTRRPDAVVTDMMLPDVDGIELMRKFKQLNPESEVIVITGQGNIPRSVEAVKAGAFDFLESRLMGTPARQAGEGIEAENPVRRERAVEGEAAGPLQISERHRQSKKMQDN